MSRTKTMRALSLLCLATLGIAGCDGSSTNTTPTYDDPDSVASAIFSILDTNYITLRTDGLFTGYSYTLSSSVGDYSDLTITYAVDESRTSYSTSYQTYTLGAQDFIYIEDDVLYIENGTVPEENSYAVFTAYVTINEEEYSHDFLVSVLQTNLISIEDIVTSSTSGDAVIFRGVYMGSNGKVRSDYGTYSAVFVADGDWAMMLYQVDEDLVSDDWVIGETVLQVVGSYSPYEGLPEVGSISAIDVVTDDTITAPTVATLTGESSLEDVRTTNAINRKYHLEDVQVFSVSTSTGASYDTLTLSLMFTGGDSIDFIDLYLTSRDSDFSILGNATSGDYITLDTWLGYSSGTYQFTYESNVSVTDGELEDGVYLNWDGNPLSTLYTGITYDAFDYNIQTIGYDDETVSWTSSETEVATIDGSTGVITPVAAGTTTITATANADTSVSISTEVTVYNVSQTQSIYGFKTSFASENEDTVQNGDKVAIYGYVDSIASAQYGNFYLVDADGYGVYVYGTDYYGDVGTLSVGQSLVAYGNAYLSDNGNYMELTDAHLILDSTERVTSTTTKWNITTGDDFNSAGFTVFNYGDKVTINGATVNTSGSRISLTLADGTNIASGTYSDDYPDIDAELTYTVEGYAAWYSSSFQINITSITPTEAGD